MTYPNQLHEYHWTMLQPVLDELKGLRPGDIKIFEYYDKKYCDRVRQVFYAWLALENKKFKYKIRRLSSKSLSIEHLHHEKPRVTGSSELRPYEEFAIDNLLSVETEEEALALIQASELTSKDKVDAVLEWRRLTEKRS